MPSLHGIHYASRHLKGWMRASRRKVGVAFQPASAKVVYQPLGVVGVIVPWNYPLYLAIGPLVGALAAGNRVMLKLSESTPATGLLLKDLLGRIFPEDLVCVVLGEADIGVAFSTAFRSFVVHRRHQHRQTRDAGRCGEPDARYPRMGGKSPAIVSHDVPSRTPPNASLSARPSTPDKPAWRRTTCWCPKTASALSSKPIARRFAGSDPGQQPGLHRDHQ
jgi:coniferyl-aldehyde dehydrogenase